jgi:hypothetical protein
VHYIALLAYLIVTGPAPVALDAIAVRFVAPDPAPVASGMRPARA